MLFQDTGEINENNNKKKENKKESRCIQENLHKLKIISSDNIKKKSSFISIKDIKSNSHRKNNILNELDQLAISENSIDNYSDLSNLTKREISNKNSNSKFFILI